MGINNLSNDEEPKDVADDIMQLAKSVKTVNKVAVSSILPSNDKFISKAKEINTHAQDICSSNNVPLITHMTLTHTVTLM